MPEVETCDMGDVGILKAGGHHGLWMRQQSSKQSNPAA